LNAIMGGLAVATVLTLVFLPALYVAWFRIKRPEPSAGKPSERSSPTAAPVREASIKDFFDVKERSTATSEAPSAGKTGGETSVRPPLESVGQ